MNKRQVVVVDVSESFKKNFVKKLDDSNTSTNITEAGIFNLMDSLIGKGKFSKEAALAELSRRGM